MLSKECLIKCTVLLPKRLYHPVLPIRCNNKLLFCLCRTCAFECNYSDQFVHKSTAQRSQTSTWILDEVLLAIQKGYEFLDTIGVYESDSQTHEGGLFAEYIKTFLKLKAEGSGYTGWVPNREAEYVMLRFSMLEMECSWIEML